MDYREWKRSEDGVMWMPISFRDIEERWLTFKEESCNFRLSMVVDSVNPFGELKSIYSIWVVFVINNNLPPWMSIKREHIMLALIVFIPYISIVILLLLDDYAI